MSIRNEDRHGLGNLTHEPVKLFDKIKWVKILMFSFVFCNFIRIVTGYMQTYNDLYVKTRQRNMLLAVRKTQ